MQIRKAPFVCRHWDIVVLHPKGLRPKSEPLIICDPRVPVTEQNPRPPSPRWESWFCDDVPYLHPKGQSSIENKRPPFSVVNTRDADVDVSPLAMVINAHSKLQQYIASRPAGTVHSHVDIVAAAIKKLYHAIVFVPQSYGDLALVTVPPVPAGLGSTTIDTSSRAGHVSAPNATQSHTSSSTSGSARYSDDPDRMVEHGESEDPWTAAAAPEEPAEDGLTDAEHEAVVRNVCNSALSHEERGNWALMMMFGTRG